MTRTFAIPSALALLLLGGCRGCEKDKPYTPFGVASSLGSASNAPIASSAPDAAGDAGGFAVKRAEKAAPGATRWTLAGRTLTAPTGRAFERAVIADFDGDDEPDAVAWTVPAKGEGNRGELWLFPGKGDAKRLTSLPGFVPSGPSCQLAPELTLTGPQSVTLDVSAKCSADFLARAPMRSLMVLSPMAEHPVVMSLRVAQAAPDEELSLDVTTLDRDGDGRDDVRLAVTVRARGSERPATAELVWLDRAAGASRDASQPRGSLGKLAAGEMWRAKRKNLAASVDAGVANVRRLMSTLCSSGGAERLLDAEGSPLSCGNLGIVVDRLGIAEITAAATRGSAIDAFGALARDGLYFGSMSSKQRKAAEKIADKLVKHVEPVSGPNIGAHPASSSAPHWSPLAFEASGALLVRTDGGVVRVASNGEESSVSVEGGIEPWPLAVTRDDGSHLAAVAYACDRSETLLSFQKGDGSFAAPVVTSVLAPRPGSCAGGKAPTLPEPVPLAIKPSGLEAFVLGKIIGPVTSPAEAVLRPQPHGTARSPDGRYLALATSSGVLLHSQDKDELWTPGGVTARDLHGCVAANDGAAIACVVRGAARVWRRN